MYWFRFFIAAVFAVCLGAAAHAEQVSFCVLNDFLQIVTYKGPDIECLEFETSLVLNSEGSQGPKGDPGPAGPPGETGATGPAGPQGPKGDTGAQGAQGEPGPQGTPGTQGEQGPAGKDGLSAFVNTAPEPPGENCKEGGIKVESGQGDTVADTTYICDGAEGPQGETGADGVQGEPGPAGPQGETGPTGAQGEQGPQGETGATGSAGEPGPRGETGPAGAQGEPGPQGPQGETGPTGADGVSAFVNTDPEPPGENCKEGGIKIETGQGDTVADTTYICDGAAGPQGETGPTGEKGPQGETGPQGLQGEIGPSGPQGEQGPPGLQGETGAAGPEGERGPQGPQGSPGPPGADGASAFVNTFAERPGENCKEGGIRIETGLNEKVIETIYMCNGAEGPEGKQGVQGSPGPQGPAGQAGPAGPAGPQGPAGSAGSAGSQGSAGPAGPKGDQGPEGAAGITILAGGTSNNVSNNATRYVNAFTVAAVNNTESNVAHRIPVAGSLTDFNAILNGSTTGSYVFTVRVNAAAPVDPLTCTISGSTSCTDNRNCYDLAAGDRVTIQSVTAGVNPRIVGTTMVFRAGAKCQ